MRKDVKSMILIWLVCLFTLSACGYIHDDLPPCPGEGLSLAFRYDYNLQRADMFPDHVGSVTVYLLDEEGYLVGKQTESGEALKACGYRMHWDIEPGKYQYVAIAGQKPFEAMWQTGGAKFRLTEPVLGDSISALSLVLDHQENGMVPHANLPLDTLWHGMQLQPVEIVAGKQTVDTVSLMRNTKQISLLFNSLDNDVTDIADFDIKITDRNARLLWNNQVDESETVMYTPYVTWNTKDFAHAELMMPRLLYHGSDQQQKDAILSVVHKQSGKEVVRINLPDMLAQLRTSAEVYRYQPQEFLDRGYDFRLTFFLKGDAWAYVNIEIATLSWTKRIQYEDFQL
ncbi:MAG: FimB/Mfa2 family fimbrial subunit [Parabacteroides sp.]|nr:FimB/Mfa2 family fimbrial subunit [Parabacteroides sp.]